MSPQLKDSFGRRIDNLRISVTDRCNFRCVYCMPNHPVWMPREELLSFEEIVRLARVFVEAGIRKIRLTGGEPTVRRDLPDLVRMLRTLPGLEDLSLTTNGYFLRRVGRTLYAAGLRRINISLDTLRREKFEEITRTKFFDNVLDGIRAAREIGFDPIKINAVIMRGYNDDEVVDFAAWARKEKIQVRFIEFMPLDGDNGWDRRKVVTKREILEQIGRVFPWERHPDANPGEPAERFRFRDGQGEFGVIGSVSEPFCGSCNRVRLTADGKLRTCLFSIGETDLKRLMRAGASDNELRDLFERAVYFKEPGHFINSEHFVKPGRTMHAIGG